MNQKNKVLVNVLQQICKLTGDAGCEADARAAGRSSFLSIDYAADYGGYRLDRTDVNDGGSIAYSIGNITDTCDRRNYAEFLSLLRGIHAGLLQDRAPVIKSGYIPVNGGERVLMALAGNGKIFFSNINNINAAVELCQAAPGTVTIFHFWNGKQTKMSRRELLEFAAANGVSINFKY